MHRSFATTLVAGLGALTLAGSAAALGTAGSDRPTGRTLSFDVQFTGFFLLDFGPTGVRQVTALDDPELSPSRGDQIVFEDRLLRRGTQVGAGGGTCTVTDVLATGLPLACQVTYELPGGQITAQGRTSTTPVKTLAVTGGTGRYAGAAGELVLTENGDAADTGTLVIRLTHR